VIPALAAARYSRTAPRKSGELRSVTADANRIREMPAPDTLIRRRERIAGIHELSIDTIELYERNIIDDLALTLVHGELPVGS
jgi:hypothetical protein